MNTLSYKTISANSATTTKEWLIIDASDARLGRLASVAAKLIRGKHKTNFTPHVDCGDNVIIINADKIDYSGVRWDQKTYIHHTGYPGGQRSKTARQVYDLDPTLLVHKAVKGMLPKNKLGSALQKNLRVFNGTEHGLDAQKPKSININEIK